VLPLGFVSFLAFGYLLVVTGASQQGISADLGLDLSEFGLLGATLALGVGLGVFVAGPLVDRWPRRPLLAASALVCAAAFGTVSAEMGETRALIHVFALGAGGGVTDTLLNAVTVERYRERAARPLALLHGAVTLGAVLAPPAIGWLTAQAGHWTGAFHAGGLAYLGLAAWTSLVPLPPPTRPAHLPSEPGRRGGIASWSLVGLCAVGFAYLGVENGVTLFAVPYASAGLGLPEQSGRDAISAFWLGLLLGRLVLAGWRRPVGEGGLALMGAGGAAALGLGIVTGWSELWAWLLAAGFALGGVFPLTVTLAGRHAPGSTGTTTGIVMGVGSLGGFALPWIAGGLGDRFGVAGAMGSLAGGCLLLALGAWRSRDSRPRSPALER